MNNPKKTVADKNTEIRLDKGNTLRKLLKGEIQWSGRFHSNHRYGPFEVWENIIFSVFAPGVQNSIS